MSALKLDTAAASLMKAYSDRTAVPPLTETIPGLTVDDAYRIQLAQVDRWTSSGRVVAGHKVGLTSAIMQQQLGVTEPDYGHLFADMFRLESLPIDTTGFINPRVEPEIAFVLAEDLAGPNVTVAQVLSAVAYVLPALEIIDSRIEGWRITLADTVADNASSAAVVLGSTPVSIRGLDLRLTGCVLERGPEVAATGAGAAVLGSPVNAVAWLANTVGALGVVIEAGSVVLPGSLTAAIPVAPGSAVTASFSGIGSVTAYFDSSERGD